MSWLCPTDSCLIGGWEAAFESKYPQPNGVNYVHQEGRRERNKALWALIKLRNEEIHHPEAERVGELRFLAQSPVMGWALSKVLTSSLAPSSWEELGEDYFSL